MSYLPKLLYFFRVLPVQVPSHILLIHQHKLLHFIWGSTCPRISKHILYAKSFSGGLSVPNLQVYYISANIAPLSHLHETHQLPLWATINLVDSDPIPGASLPLLPPAYRPTVEPCLAHSLK